MGTTKTKQVQAAVDALRGRAQEYSEKADSCRRELAKLSASIGSALLDGTDSIEALRVQHSGLETNIRILDAAATEAQVRLKKAEAELDAAKKVDAQTRITDIVKELSTTADELEGHLAKGRDVAARLDNLIVESVTLNRTLGISLAALGSWAQLANGGGFAAGMDSVINYLTSCRPKAGEGLAK